MYINSFIPWVNDDEIFSRIISLAYKVGYQGAIINFNSVSDFLEAKINWNMKKDLTNKFPVTLNWIQYYKPTFSSIPLIPRITIKSNKEQDLKKKLTDISKNSCLISVESSNQQVLEVAARDGRVDIINIPNLAHLQSITKGIVSLCKQNACLLDLNWSLILNDNKFQKSRILREYYKLFLEFHPNTHSYSIGAYSELLENPWLIRGPNEILHSLVCLFEIPYDHAKTIVKNNIEELVMRFIKRDQKLFIEPGVEIVDIRKESQPGDFHEEN